MSKSREKGRSEKRGRRSAKRRGTALEDYFVKELQSIGFEAKKEERGPSFAEKRTDVLFSFGEFKGILESKNRKEWVSKAFMDWLSQAEEDSARFSERRWWMVGHCNSPGRGRARDPIVIIKWSIMKEILEELRKANDIGRPCTESFTGREAMNITKLKEALREAEGLELKTYQCPSGKWTIGYGRNLEDRGITKGEAEYMLSNDVMYLDGIVRKEFGKDLDVLPESTQVALAEITHTMGPDWFKKFPRCVAGITQAALGTEALRSVNLEQASWELLHQGERCERCRGRGVDDRARYDCDACFGEGYTPSLWRTQVGEERAQRVARWLRGFWIEAGEESPQPTEK